MLVFSVLLLLLVGTVFVYSPAIILGDMTGGGNVSVAVWVVAIFIYYIIATLLPIDKIIGRIYPVFSVALLFMAAALLVCLVVKWPSIPELWDGLGGWSGKVALKDQPIFPCLFITIACGAVSGFHSTQSPLMARCLGNEKLGRPVFYGAMITEGLVALIWAAVSSWFFFDGGAAQVGSDITASAPAVVTKVSRGWLGIFGGILALLLETRHPGTLGRLAISGTNLSPEGIVPDFIEEYTELNKKEPDPLVTLMLTEPHIDPKSLQTITIPVLVTVGENDLILRSETDKIMANLPDAELVVVKGADHGSYIVDSEIMGNLLIDFLSRHE